MVELIELVIAIFDMLNPILILGALLASLLGMFGITRVDWGSVGMAFLVSFIIYPIFRGFLLGIRAKHLARRKKFDADDLYSDYFRERKKRDDDFYNFS